MANPAARSWLWSLVALSGLAIGLAAQTPAGVTEEDLLASPGEEWLTYGGNYAEWHYSPLDQIDTSNVGRLGVAWQREIVGTAGNLEATPLVHDGVIYATGTWSTVFALDARTGAVRWQWDPAIVRGGITSGGPSVCCGPVNRGVALYGNNVYVGVLDGRLVALNKDTGLPEWSVQTTPLGTDYSITGAPRVVKGNVIIGNSGAEYGVRGYVSAYDAETGALQWRFHTVPGNPADSFENEAMRRAAETWTGEWWEVGGGGTVWDGMAFDPVETLLYIGTGNGSPWNRDVRSPGGGDNLYLSSILALDPDTGELVWHYQTTPGDGWDYTAVQALMLLDLEFDGRFRKVIVQAPKNGFFYVLDRVTGELLSAEKFADDVTWAALVDLETGRPLEAPNARYGLTGQGAWLSPSPGGAHNWDPMSFNPATGLVYLPIRNANFFYTRSAEFEYRQGQFNLGVPFGGGADDEERPPRPELEGPRRALVARNPVTNVEVWRAEREDNNNGGTLSTAGSLVFAPGDGRFWAHDASSGQVLWSAYVGGSLATPVAYELDGRQYIVTEVGAGGGETGPATPARMIAFVLDGLLLPEPQPAATEE